MNSVFPGLKRRYHLLKLFAPQPFVPAQFILLTNNKERQDRESERLLREYVNGFQLPRLKEALDTNILR